MGKVSKKFIPPTYFVLRLPSPHSCDLVSNYQPTTIFYIFVKSLFLKVWKIKVGI